MAIYVSDSNSNHEMQIEKLEIESWELEMEIGGFKFEAQPSTITWFV